MSKPIDFHDDVIKKLKGLRGAGFPEKEAAHFTSLVWEKISHDQAPHFSLSLIPALGIVSVLILVIWGFWQVMKVPFSPIPSLDLTHVVGTVIQAEGLSQDQVNTTIREGDTLHLSHSIKKLPVE